LGPRPGSPLGRAAAFGQVSGDAAAQADGGPLAGRYHGGRLASRCRLAARVRTVELWRKAVVANPWGFLRHARREPPKRPVDQRLRDWDPVYGRPAPADVRIQ